MGILDLNDEKAITKDSKFVEMFPEPAVSLIKQKDTVHTPCSTKLDLGFLKVIIAALILL